MVGKKKFFPTTSGKFPTRDGKKPNSKTLDNCTGHCSNSDVIVTPTVRLTSTGNSVSEYRDFPFAPTETIVGQVEKIGSLIWGMAWRSILAEI